MAAAERDAKRRPQPLGNTRLSPQKRKSKLKKLFNYGNYDD
jgi:hypothetical protein